MEAASTVDVSKGPISNAATGRRNTSAGYKWSYIKDIVYSTEKSVNDISIENG